MTGNKVLMVCTTDAMIWNFLIPHIRALQEDGYVVECACARTGFYLDEIRSLWGLKVHELAFKRSPFHFSNLFCLIRLIRLIRVGGYDLIHCHEPVGGMMGRIAGKACKKKVFYTAHGFHFFEGAPKHHLIYYLAEKLLARLTDVTITICAEDFEHAKKLPSRQQYYIHGIGVDYTKIEASLADKGETRKEFNLDASDTVLLSVGELIKRKNHAAVIKALAQLKDCQVKYVICGEGRLEGKLKKLCGKLHVEDSVLFLGFRRDVGKILSMADVFVFPSLWEGLGIAGLEAMYAGLPVLASDRQGIRDYVINNVTGILFDPLDVDAIANSISRILENRKLAEDFNRNASEILPLFSMSNSIAEMRAIYLRNPKKIDAMTEILKAADMRQEISQK